MKKLFIYISLIIAALPACKKQNDRVYDQSPEQRVSAELDKYQTLLESAPYGWKGVIITDSGRGAAYGFYFKFNDSNRVKMYSDFNDSFSSNLKESSYRLKALQQVTLLFDTYSYIHALADPDPGVAGGELGAGYGVDFEFYFDGVTNDTIHLYGIRQNNKALLIRATQDDANAYNSGQLKRFSDFNVNYNKIPYYWKSITINGVTFQVSIDTRSRSLVFTWMEGGQVKTFTTSYYFTATGMVLVNPLKAGGVTVSELRDVAWSAGTSTISVTANGVPTSLSGVNAPPVYVDENAAANWYNTAVNQNIRWISLDGFHVNGVDDAYGITKIPQYYYMGFYPAGMVGGLPTNVDFAGIYINKPNDADSVGLYYGITMTTDVTSVKGKAIFSAQQVLGDLDPDNRPGDIPIYNAIYNTGFQFNSAAGYYFVKTGETSYDMVSVSDATRWISWFR